MPRVHLCCSMFYESVHLLLYLQPYMFYNRKSLTCCSVVIPDLTPPMCNMTFSYNKITRHIIYMYNRLLYMFVTLQKEQFLQVPCPTSGSQVLVSHYRASGSIPCGFIRDLWWRKQQRSRFPPPMFLWFFLLIITDHWSILIYHCSMWCLLALTIITFSFFTKSMV